ncbi:MAG: type II secretion system protein [Nitrospirae bacterium]|nr:type II secretion system protein [Nitrospirota bacterium]
MKVESYPPFNPPLAKGGRWGGRNLHRASCIMHRGKKGFTLIELVITMVLISIVAFIAADAISTGLKAFFATDNRNEALQQVRIAMERTTREIRNVRSSADVGTGNATQFCFINTDGTMVSFRYSSNTIIREEPAACPGGAGNTLANNITALTLSYIRSDGTSDAAFSAANTKRIRLVITSTVSGESVTLQSEVWPRSL